MCLLSVFVFGAQTEPICNDGVVMDALWAQMADYRFCNQLGRPFGAARRPKITKYGADTSSHSGVTRHLHAIFHPILAPKWSPTECFQDPLRTTKVVFSVGRYAISRENACSMAL